MRHEKLMSVTHNNWALRDDLNKTQTDAKTSILKQEKEWVSSMINAQRTEDNFNKNLRNDIRNDLRQTLA